MNPCNNASKLPPGYRELTSDQANALSLFPPGAPVLFNIVQQNSPFTGECHNCGERGHRQADCVRSRRDRSHTAERVRCDECNRHGHKTADCWHNPENAHLRPSRYDGCSFNFQSGVVKAVYLSPKKERFLYEVEQEDGSNQFLPQQCLNFGINCPVTVELKDGEIDGTVLCCRPERREIIYTVSFSLGRNGHKLEDGLAFKKLTYRQKNSMRDASTARNSYVSDDEANDALSMRRDNMVVQNVRNDERGYPPKEATEEETEEGEVEDEPNQDDVSSTEMDRSQSDELPNPKDILRGDTANKSDYTIPRKKRRKRENASTLADSGGSPSGKRRRKGDSLVVRSKAKSTLANKWMIMDA
ncbi:hypothetical protein ACHAXT_012248 [Thalassiosira profunda]